MSNSTGVVTIASEYSFDETVDRLRGAIADRELILFLALDQQAAARTDGVTMPKAQLLVFGRPKAGTQILIDFPEAGLDLPLKVYVWESSNREGLCQLFGTIVHRPSVRPVRRPDGSVVWGG